MNHSLNHKKIVEETRGKIKNFLEYFELHNNYNEREKLTNTLMNLFTEAFREIEEKSFKEGRINLAEEVLATYRRRKIDDMTKYIIILNIAKGETHESEE